MVGTTIAWLTASLVAIEIAGRVGAAWPHVGAPSVISERVIGVPRERTHDSSQLQFLYRNQPASQVTKPREYRRAEFDVDVTSAGGARTMMRVKAGILSLTLPAPRDDDGSYLRWHLLDHQREQYQLPGIVTHSAGSRTAIT